VVQLVAYSVAQSDLAHRLQDGHVHDGDPIIGAQAHRHLSEPLLRSESCKAARQQPFTVLVYWMPWISPGCGSRSNESDRCIQAVSERYCPLILSQSTPFSRLPSVLLPSAQSIGPRRRYPLGLLDAPLDLLLALLQSRFEPLILPFAPVSGRRRHPQVSSLYNNFCIVDRGAMPNLVSAPTITTPRSTTALATAAFWSSTHLLGAASISISSSQSEHGLCVSPFFTSTIVATIQRESSNRNELEGDCHYGSPLRVLAHLTSQSKCQTNKVQCL
jgi:hypothetical protein